MKEADRVLLNGIIYTVDESFSAVEAMAVKGKKILYTGSSEGARAFIGPDTAVTDLRGKTVLPGFIESHIHMNEYGNLASRYEAYGKTKEQILSDIHAAVSGMEPGAWFLGAPRGDGFDYRLWEPAELPSLEELDEAAPDHPVALFPAAAGGRHLGEYENVGGVWL